jgi:NAD(P)-dependent dehydrogenase (short-subunit alcohol dehydrogenase family)
MSTKSLAVIAGVGGALGPALVQALSAKGYLVVGISHSGKYDINATASVEIFKGDLADSAFVEETHSKVTAQYGEPEVLIYNAHQLLISSFAEISAAQFEDLNRPGIAGGSNS